MKFLIIALFVAAATATELDSAAQVLKSAYDQTAQGYQYNYQNSNGISGNAVGTLKHFDDKDKTDAVVVQGENSYDNEGKTYVLTYTADENGYQPKADFLPTPPAPVPIPEYIRAAIEWTAAHPYKEEKKN